MGFSERLDLLLAAKRCIEAYCGIVPGTSGTASRVVDVLGVDAKDALVQLRLTANALRFVTYESYVGETLNGKRHGQGSCIMSDGFDAKNSGSWADDLPDGFNIYEEPNSVYYKGMWKAGEWHGQGEFMDVDGSIYSGNYVLGTKEGQGTRSWIWGDQFKYTGEWKSNVPHGHGKMVFFHDGTYEGQWVDGFMHGHGVLRKWNDDIHEGEFVRGTPQGAINRSTIDSKDELDVNHRVIHYQSGAVYEGPTVNGRPEGKGVLRAPTNITWTGTFEDGSIHGEGMAEWDNGGYRKGTWKNDWSDGRGIEVNNDPRYPCRFEGTIVSGLREGYGVYTAPQGVSYKGGFHVGEMHGEAVQESKRGGSGKLECRFENGVPSGPGRIVRPGGSVYEGLFVNRKEHDENAILTFPDGTLYKGTWVQGFSLGKDSFTGPLKELIFWAW